MKIKKLFSVLLSLLLVASNTSLKASDDDTDELKEMSMAIRYDGAKDSDNEDGQDIMYFGPNILGKQFSEVIKYIKSEEKSAKNFYVMTIDDNSCAVACSDKLRENTSEKVKRGDFFAWNNSQSFAKASKKSEYLYGCSFQDKYIINDIPIRNTDENKKNKWYLLATNHPITTIAIVLTLLAIGMALFIASKKKKAIEPIEEVEL